MVRRPRGQGSSQRRRPWRHLGLGLSLIVTAALAGLAARAGSLAVGTGQAGHLTAPLGPARAALRDSAAVALGRAVEHLGLLASGSATWPERLPLVLACIGAALLLYVAVARIYGRAAAALAALVPALAPLSAATVRAADPAALVLTAAAAAAFLALEAARRPALWRIAAALLLAGAALVPLFGLGAALAAPAHNAHALVAVFGAARLPSLLVPGSLAGAALLFARLPRPSARLRAAAAMATGLVAALGLALWQPAMALDASLAALPAAAVLFAAAAATLVRALGRRGWPRYALAAWIAVTAVAEVALSAQPFDAPYLPAAVVVVGVGAAVALAVGRTPIFETAAGVSQAVPVLLALVALLALPAAATLNAAAPRPSDRATAYAGPHPSESGAETARRATTRQSP